MPSITTFNIMTPSIMTFSIKLYKTRHSASWQSLVKLTVIYAYGHLMLSVVRLNVILLSVMAP